jgi:hypothetical protein
MDGEIEISASPDTIGWLLKMMLMGGPRKPPPLEIMMWEDDGGAVLDDQNDYVHHIVEGASPYWKTWHKRVGAQA